VKIAIGILFAATAFAQQYELGADIGYGIYHNGTIFSSAGTAEAGIRNRFAAGIVFGDEFSPYVSAEFQYLYHDGHPFLQAPGVRTDIQGNSEALTYNLLFHFKTREHRWRPYLAGGAGGKEYVIAGPEPFPQPIPQIASLTTNGGVHGRRRLEIHAAAAHAGARGIPRLPDHLPAPADCARAAQHRPRDRGAIYAAVWAQLYHRAEVLNCLGIAA
jgi:hypothetical protein